MLKGPLLGQGRTAQIYAWGDDQILKLYREFVPDGWIQHEAWVGRIVMEAGLAVPAVGDLIHVDGQRGLIYERVDGPTMLQSVARQPWIVPQAARQFAALHAEMHNCHRPELPDQREQLRRSIGRVTQLSDAVKARILRRLETLPTDTAVCHGDFHPDNILMSSRGPVVIDWMTANHGNPAADVARTTLLFLGRSLPPGMVPLRKVFFQALRRLYYTLYLHEYQRHHRLSWMEIEVWLPILAAARLDEQIPEEEASLQARVKAAFG